ncbi:hypothetical protein [Bizionia myxarmorum]|uniref:hypothetical protein n=1 Tax=Bizionia myxarmorum TaxID=291186 RepID=UPI00147960AC|nr:hypothetical protein [Bizionia myxarmorum]
MPNLIATAVVTRDDALAINFDLENHFFKTMKRRLFPNMKSAEHWIVEKINTA